MRDIRAIPKRGFDIETVAASVAEECVITIAAALLGEPGPANDFWNHSLLENS
ncbi:MAG: hypothetical protein ACI8UO_003330 [Verrucomicrobiales bacterium]|jgi:hypothetical protein